MLRVERVGEWVSAEVGADRVMMNVASGHYLGMTAIGAQIWDQLDGKTSVEDLCARLVRRYDVDTKTCQAEVQAFLGELAKLGAVTLQPVEP